MFKVNMFYQNSTISSHTTQQRCARFIAAQFQFAKKGSLWTAPSMEWFNGMVFFGRNNKNRSSVFRKLLFFAVCFDWVSYESCSFNWVMFLVKKKVPFPAKLITFLGKISLSSNSQDEKSQFRKKWFDICRTMASYTSILHLWLIWLLQHDEAS